MPGEAADNEPLLREEEDRGSAASKQVSIWWLRISFFLFGTINNGKSPLVALSFRCSCGLILTLQFYM